MKREFSAGVVVYYHNNNDIQFLLLHYEAGHWDLPKGHLEPNESTYDAALRELREETGITHIAINPKFEESFEYFLTNKEHQVVLKKVSFFLGRTQERTVTLSSEHTDYAWLPYKEALKQLTYKNAQDLIKKAYAFLVKEGNNLAD